MSKSVVEQQAIEKSYSREFPALGQLATELRAELESVLRDAPRVDRICVRAKSVRRFLEKAQRIDPETGESRYPLPHEDIQDQIGARVIVFYRSDVKAARKCILDEYREIEDRSVEHPDPHAFGYEARHIICLIPLDLQKKHKVSVGFFEIQVCTLFQHAWAEANHDLGYKPRSELTDDEEKLVAWAAAQAWGADEIFNRLHNKESGSSANLLEVEQTVP